MATNESIRDEVDALFVRSDARTHELLGMILEAVIQSEHAARASYVASERVLSDESIHLASGLPNDHQAA